MLNVGLLLLLDVGWRTTGPSGRASLKITARNSKWRRGKAVSDRSSNKYGTLISFAPAVAVLAEGPFLLSVLPVRSSPRPRPRPHPRHLATHTPPGPNKHLNYLYL